MNSTEIFNKTLKTNFLIIEEDEFKNILDNSEIIRVEDTHLSDFIRILLYDNNIFIQEISFNNEIIIRKRIQLKTRKSLYRKD